MLITQGIHTLDLMLSLAGPIAEVSGYARTTRVHRMETEDLVVRGRALRQRGASASSTPPPPPIRAVPERIELIGTKGAASLVGTALDVQYHDGRAREDRADALRRRHRCRSDGLPARLSPRACGAISSMRSTGPAAARLRREALEVHRLIDALLEAGATGRKVAVR